MGRIRTWGVNCTLAHEIVEKELRSVEVIAIVTLAFRVLFWYVDWFRRGER